MRLDAAPSYSLRSAARKAIGGVALPEAQAAAGQAAQTSPQAAEPAKPPPSIDGKGTLINIYA